MARGFDLSANGICAPDVLRNPSPGLLYEDGIVCDGDWIVNCGALATNSGDHTKRSKRDWWIVEDEIQEADWNLDQRLPEKTYASLRKQAVDYFNTCGRLYVVDGLLGADPRWQLRVRVICVRPYHALAVRNWLIPDLRQSNPGEPELVLFNAGQLPAEPRTPGLATGTCVALHGERGEIVILGTEYAGEMLQSLLALWRQRMHRRDLFSVRGSVSRGETGETSLLLGGPGSGKTVLAAACERSILADDLVGWSDEGPIGVTGGCYPRCLGHSAALNPELERAIGFGVVLENVVVDSHSRKIDYADRSVAENPRAILSLANFCGGVAPNLSAARPPAHAILLVADSSGVLPLASRLSPEQAFYQLLSGYSPKVTVSESGEVVPQVAFSTCFGATAVSGDPLAYASQLVERLRAHQTQLWLVNTGWVTGPANTAERIDLKITRAILQAIYNGALKQVETTADPTFGWQVPREVPGVPGSNLKAEIRWGNADAYRQAAAQLAEQFQRHFQQFASTAPAAVRQAGPATRQPAAV